MKGLVIGLSTVLLVWVLASGVAFCRWAFRGKARSTIRWRNHEEILSSVFVTPRRHHWADGFVASVGNRRQLTCIGALTGVRRTPRTAGQAAVAQRQWHQPKLERLCGGNQPQFTSRRRGHRRQRFVGRAGRDRQQFHQDLLLRVARYRRVLGRHR